MRYLTHARGRGRIDETSEICSFSHLDRASILEKQSSVWSSHITGSSVKKSTVTGAIISDSAIADSLITGGKIVNSVISAELVADYALIKNSNVFRKCRIAHTAFLDDVSIENLTVSGDAKLIGWSKDFILFDGKEGYIDAGVWERPPRILALDGLTITEGIPGFAFCGCKKFSISHWLKIGDRYGAKLKLSVPQVDEIRQFLLSLGS